MNLLDNQGASRKVKGRIIPMNQLCSDRNKNGANLVLCKDIEANLERLAKLKPHEAILNTQMQATSVPTSKPKDMCRVMKAPPAQ